MELLSVEDRDLTRWITVRGDLNQLEVLSIRSSFDEAIDSAPGDVVIEMSEVTFIGTLGVGLVIAANDRLRKRGGRLRLSNVPGVVERALQHMSVHDRFERI